MAKKNDELMLNIYDKDDNVVKTVTARTVSLRFGVVRSLMEILNIDNVDSTADLLKTVYGAWDEIKLILVKVFPDATLDELDNTNINELVPVVLTAIKYSFAEIAAIPVDEKN